MFCTMHSAVVATNCVSTVSETDCFTISIHEALLHSQERLTDRRVRGEEKISSLASTSVGAIKHNRTTNVLAMFLASHLHRETSVTK